MSLLQHLDPARPSTCRREHTLMRGNKVCWLIIVAGGAERSQRQASARHADAARQLVCSDPHQGAGMGCHSAL